MKMNIYCCLLAAWVLGCKVTADLPHKVVEEKNEVILPCHRSVDDAVTWSRETDGSKVHLITAGVGNTKHNNLDRRYMTLSDKFRSLIFLKASVSDSGTYFCNNEPAVKLTVIPSGTRIVNVTEGTRVLLNCSHPVGGSDISSWSKQIAGKQQTIRPEVSIVDKTLIITDVKPADSGLYNCSGKAAVYLAVNKGTTRSTATMKTLTSTTTSTQVNSTDKQLPLDLLLGVGVLILLIFIIIVGVIYFTRKRRLKRQERNERHVYDEIPAAEELRPTNGLHSFAGAGETVYYMIDFPGGSNQNDCTYSTIPYMPPTGNNTESPYSLLGANFCVGNKVCHG